MAKCLDQFNFRARPHRKYPWEDWLDGRIWELVRGEGEDFTVRVDNLRVTATVEARRRGLHVRTSVREGKYLVIQAFPIDPETKEV